MHQRGHHAEWHEMLGNDHTLEKKILPVFTWIMLPADSSSQFSLHLGCNFVAIYYMLRVMMNIFAMILHRIFIFLTQNLHLFNSSRISILADWYAFEKRSFTGINDQCNIVKAVYSCLLLVRNHILGCFTLASFPSVNDFAGE